MYKKGNNDGRGGSGPRQQPAKLATPKGARKTGDAEDRSARGRLFIVALKRNFTYEAMRI